MLGSAARLKLEDRESYRSLDRRGDLVVQPPRAVKALRRDAILITTFRHVQDIRLRLDHTFPPRVPLVEL